MVGGEREREIWCWFELTHFLILQRSGINSLLSYIHCERIRRVQEEFKYEPLNSRTGGGNKQTISDRCSNVEGKIKI